MFQGRKIDYKKLLIPSDFILILVIIVGLLIAIFLDEGAIKLIGASISVLSVVMLFMLISQRISDSVAIRHTPKEPQDKFKVTHTKDTSAKRTVIENFNDALGDDDSEFRTKRKPAPKPAADFITRPAAEKEISNETIETRVKQPPKPKPVPEDNSKQKDIPIPPKMPFRENKIDENKSITQDSVDNDFMGSDEGFRIIKKGSVKKSNAQPEPKIETNEPPEIKNEIFPEPLKIPETPEPENNEKNTERPEEIKNNQLRSAAATSETDAKQTIRPKLSKNARKKNRNKKRKQTSNIDRPVSDKIKRTDDEPTAKDPIVNKTEIRQEKPEVESLNEQKPEIKEKIVPIPPEIQDQPVPEIIDKKDKAKDVQEVLNFDTVEENEKTTGNIQEENCPDVDYKTKDIELPLSSLMEDIQIENSEPRLEFEYFLSRLLMSIRSVTNTRTASFFLYNSERRELILEAFETDVPRSLKEERRFPAGNDIISQICMNAKPEILTEINPNAELDLLPYYKRAAKISSFIGVPVFFESDLVGVICADSNVSDVYDSVTVGFLGHYSKMIAALIQGYTEKYDLIQASNTLGALSKFRGLMEKAGTEIIEIVNALNETVSGMFDYEHCGVIGYDSSIDAWKILKRNVNGSLSDKIPAKIIDLNNTICGQVIKSGKRSIISSMDSSQIRIYPGEERLEGGFIAAFPIPLRTLRSTYGVLYFESEKPCMLSPHDINILETLCYQTGNALERIHFVEMLQSSALFDANTGMMNEASFGYRIEEEYHRSVDFGQSASLCLFSLDYYSSLDPQNYPERLEQAIDHTIGLVSGNIRPYDVFGRAEGSIYGILLVGTNLDQAQMWAEKIRREIAGESINIDGQNYTVTVSIGISEISSGESPEVVFDNARLVLDMSLQKTNSVTCYS